MRFLCFLSLVIIGLSSCKTQKAVYNYLEDFTDTTSKKSYFITEPVIQKNDRLTVQVFSASLDEKIDQLYNQQTNSIGGGIQNQNMYGYLVDQRGNIELPRIGQVHAEGLTKEQLAGAIKEKLKGQLQEPNVIIQFINFRIIVIGEVGSPGVKTVGVDNLTLLEALAMAGDITEFGKKKEVKILRESNGMRQLGIVDVTNSKMFESPYYQLQQNDVVMVEQTRYKVRQTEQQRITQQVGFTLSIITTIAFLINVIK
jgi:polysaccharide biosynthesis/export protein